MKSLHRQEKPSYLDERRKTYLFAVRVPNVAIHTRLRDAAAADGMTMAGELVRLLDLRDQFEMLTDPSYGPSMPAAVPGVLPREVEPMIEGVDWFYGKTYTRETLARMKAHSGRSAAS